jgi:hypothetical protein
VRAVAALLLALPLVAADLWLKEKALTPDWAYHQRSLAWVALCMGLVPLLVVLTRIPDALIPPAAAVLLAGLLGNLLSALTNGLEVPNPILVRGDGGELAFNLADLYSIVGVALLVATISVWLVRNRQLLPDAKGERDDAQQEDWGTDQAPLP